MAARNRPALRFAGKNRDDYRRWRKAFQDRYREMLGRFPARTPLRARVLERWAFPRYLREKVIFDSEPCMSVPAWVCLPAGLRRGQRCPAVLCCHGHGGGGREMIGINREGHAIRSYAKNLAVRLAEAGFVTISPDWRGFGDRAELPENDPGPRDICNLGHLAAEHYGYNLLALDVWDAMRTVDYLVSRPDVDARRIGCAGVSFGGTMTLFLAAADPRIRAACISGYLGSTAEALVRWGTCGSQTLPGLLRWGDRAEVAGLICPRPLLIQIGEYDSTFPAADALREYQRLQEIYRAAGAEDRLELDLFEGCHEINAAPLLQWLARRIGVK